MGATPLRAQTFFSRATGVAEHYGFCNVDDLAIKERATHAADALETPATEQGMYDHHVVAHALARLAESVEFKKRNAVMFYTPSVLRDPARPGNTISALTLNAVGSSDPLSEIVTLRCAASILSELGARQPVVRVNSLGDSDSAARFVREVGNHLRTRMRELPEGYPELMKHDIKSAIASLYEARHPITDDLPRPIEFLTAPSRRHFKEILELLEQAELPFELDDRLYGNQSMYAHTIVEFVDAAEETPTARVVLARGGRYDALTRAYARSTIPATGIVIASETKDAPKAMGRTRSKRASACLVHIGREARIKSIGIIETFRQAKIPLEQCLHFERFSEQIAYAEALGAKHILIIGQREAQEGIAIVRDTANRSQHTVSLTALPEFVRSAA